MIYDIFCMYVYIYIHILYVYSPKNYLKVCVLLNGTFTAAAAAAADSCTPTQRLQHLHTHMHIYLNHSLWCSCVIAQGHSAAAIRLIMQNQGIIHFFMLDNVLVGEMPPHMSQTTFQAQSFPLTTAEREPRGTIW